MNIDATDLNRDLCPETENGTGRAPVPARAQPHAVARSFMWVPWHPGRIIRRQRR